MARRSSIDRLPPEIREEIGRLRERGHTIDEILAHLRLLGVTEISRTALGRKVQQLDKVGERIREQRALAEALVSRFGERPENRLAQLNIELLHGALLNLAVSEDGAPVELDAKEAFFLAKALKDLAGAEKVVGDVVKLRQELKEKVDATLRQAEAEAAKAGATGDDKADLAAALKRIREEVYGIFQ